MTGERKKKERRGQSEVRRKTGSVEKVGWEVKEKSETDWSWTTGSKSLKRETGKQRSENTRQSFTGLPSSEASWLL